MAIVKSNYGVPIVSPPKVQPTQQDPYGPTGAGYTNLIAMPASSPTRTATSSDYANLSSALSSGSWTGGTSPSSGAARAAEADRIEAYYNSLLYAARAAQAEEAARQQALAEQMAMQAEAKRRADLKAQQEYQKQMDALAQTRMDIGKNTMWMRPDLQPGQKPRKEPPTAPEPPVSGLQRAMAAAVTDTPSKRDQSVTDKLASILGKTALGGVSSAIANAIGLGGMVPALQQGAQAAQPILQELFGGERGPIFGGSVIPVPQLPQMQAAGQPGPFRNAQARAGFTPNPALGPVMPGPFSTTPRVNFTPSNEPVGPPAQIDPNAMWSVITPPGDATVTPGQYNLMMQPLTGPGGQGPYLPTIMKGMQPAVDWKAVGVNPELGNKWEKIHEALMGYKINEGPSTDPALNAGVNTAALLQSMFNEMGGGEAIQEPFAGFPSYQAWVDAFMQANGREPTAQDVAAALQQYEAQLQNQMSQTYLEEPEPVASSGGYSNPWSDWTDWSSNYTPYTPPPPKGRPWWWVNMARGI